MNGSADEGHQERIAAAAAQRIELGCNEYRTQWLESGPVRHFVVDDLLPEPLVAEIEASLPTPGDLTARSSIRERKKVGIDLERYAPMAAGALLAFQDPRVLGAVERVVGSQRLRTDPSLYASGLSVMERGDFLHPHIDNSHDGDQVLYRVLNLLYYVSHDWELANGGNLELWENRTHPPTTLVSTSNRLVVMETGPSSWHSVSEVQVDRPRWCVSNYYFCESPVQGESPYRHVTTFRGRPGSGLEGPLLWLDGLARNTLGRALPFLLTRSWHRRKPRP
ncbi:2OG-Fe(II) oxygenase [Myxococcota bacterium]|nr:2OG-Fe(II) oxygenase [Myxococcota bacterium]